MFGKRWLVTLAFIASFTWQAAFACSNHPPAPDAGSSPSGNSGGNTSSFAPSTASVGGSGRGGFFAPKGAGGTPSQLDDKVFDSVGRESNPNWTSAIQ